MMNAVEPNSTRLPARTWTGSRTSQPLSLVPLCDPRSLSTQPSSRRTRRACIRDTDKSVRQRSQSRVRPMVNRDPAARREDERHRVWAGGGRAGGTTGLPGGDSGTQAIPCAPGG